MSALLVTRVMSAPQRSVRCSHCDAVREISSADGYDQAADLFPDCEMEPGVFYVKCTAWPADWR